MSHKRTGVIAVMFALLANFVFAPAAFASDNGKFDSTRSRMNKEMADIKVTMAGLSYEEEEVLSYVTGAMMASGAAYWVGKAFKDYLHFNRMLKQARRLPAPPAGAADKLLPGQYAAIQQNLKELYEARVRLYRAESAVRKANRFDNAHFFQGRPYPLGMRNAKEMLDWTVGLKGKAYTAREEIKLLEKNLVGRTERYLARFNSVMGVGVKAGAEAVAGTTAKAETKAATGATVKAAGKSLGKAVTKKVLLLGLLAVSVDALASDDRNIERAARMAENPELAFDLSEEEASAIRESAEEGPLKTVYYDIAQSVHEFAQMPKEEQVETLKEFASQEQKETPAKPTSTWKNVPSLAY